MLKPSDFFELNGFSHAGLFRDITAVWEVLPRIKQYIRDNLAPNTSVVPKNGWMVPMTIILHQGEAIESGFDIQDGEAAKGTLKVYAGGKELTGAAVLYAGCFLSGDAIAIGEGTAVEPGAFIKGPVIIGRNSEVRQGAYIRGNCVVGDRCVVGHTTEMKNSVMLNGAKAGHFAYIGDSILGNDVNLGAGTKCANLKITHTEVKVRVEARHESTGLKKFGAILGDGVETGCNSVTSPGCLLGPFSLVYPNVTVPGGYYPPKSVIHRVS